MNEALVLELLSDAKYDFEHGAFNALKQAEFFKAMEEAMATEKPKVAKAASTTTKK